MTNKDTRFIECECGASEEFFADMPRHHSQFFTIVENSQTEDNNASYVCPECSKVVKSTIIKES